MPLGAGARRRPRCRRSRPTSTARRSTRCGGRWAHALAAVRLAGSRLSKAGLVKRAPGADGRSVSIRLTDGGSAVAARIQTAREAALREVLAPLSEAERAELTRLHEKSWTASPRPRGRRHMCARSADADACGHAEGRCPVTAGGRPRRGRCRLSCRRGPQTRAGMARGRGACGLSRGLSFHNRRYRALPGGAPVATLRGMRSPRILVSPSSCSPSSSRCSCPRRRWPRTRARHARRPSTSSTTIRSAAPPARGGSVHDQRARRSELRRGIRPVPAVPRGLGRCLPCPWVLDASPRRRSPAGPEASSASASRAGGRPRRRRRRRPLRPACLPVLLHCAAQRQHRQLPDPTRPLPHHPAVGREHQLRARLGAVRAVPPGLRRRAAAAVAPRLSTGTFRRGARDVGFRVKPWNSPVPPNRGGGNHPSDGSRCPGTFRVLNNDRIGALRLPSGPYYVTVLRGANLSCQGASAAVRAVPPGLRRGASLPMATERQHGDVHPGTRQQHRLPGQARPVGTAAGGSAAASPGILRGMSESETPEIQDIALSPQRR